MAYRNSNILISTCILQCLYRDKGCSEVIVSPNKKYLLHLVLSEATHNFKTNKENVEHIGFPKLLQYLSKS